MIGELYARVERRADRLCGRHIGVWRGRARFNLLLCKLDEIVAGAARFGPGLTEA